MSQLCFHAPADQSQGSGFIARICRAFAEVGFPVCKVVRDHFSPDRIVVHTRTGGDLPPKAEQAALRLGLK